MRPVRPRVFARVVVVSAVGTVLPLVGPAPVASALVVPIPMGVSVGSYPGPSNATAHLVCAWGTAASPSSRWDLLITGTRVYDVSVGGGESTTEVSGWVIDQRYTFTTPRFQTSPCILVPHAASVTGSFQATLTYVGVGTDVVGAVAGQGVWAGNVSTSRSMDIGGGPMP